MNKVILTGNLTGTPKMGDCANGSKYLNFNLAVDDGYGENKTTDFFWCTKYGDNVDKLAGYLLKGTKVLIEGKIKNKQWIGKDGEQNYSTGIRVTNLEFIGAKPKEQSDGR